MVRRSERFTIKYIYDATLTQLPEISQKNYDFSQCSGHFQPVSCRKPYYMAKVSDNILFTGTYGDICFYQVAGATFARKKSSLTRKRVLKDKEFEKTRKYASDLGTASKIASAIYKTLPADIKGRWIFRAIAGDAASMLYKGKSEVYTHKKRLPFSGQPLSK